MEITSVFQILPVYGGWLTIGIISLFVLFFISLIAPKNFESNLALLDFNGKLTFGDFIVAALIGGSMILVIVAAIIEIAVYKIRNLFK